MRKITRILIWILAVSVIFGVVPIYAADNSPAYYVKGSIIDGDIFEVNLSIKNILANGGSFIFEFDPTKLEPVYKDVDDYNSITTGVTADMVIKTASVASVAPLRTKWLSENSLYFGWIGANNSRVNAQDSEVQIAVIYFKLKEGISEDDFDYKTLRCKNVVSTDKNDGYPDWNSGAWLQAWAPAQGVDYKYNVLGVKQCGVYIEYNGCDVIPPSLPELIFTVKNTAINGGSPISGAEVSIDARSYTSDTLGNVTIKLDDKEYAYSISKDGYKTESGVVNVSGDTEKVVELLSAQEVVDLDKEALEIIYAEGEDKDNVRSRVDLPHSGKNGSAVTWSSDKATVITSEGLVMRPKKGNENVVLTATISFGSAQNGIKEFLNIVIGEDTSAPPTSQGSSGGVQSGSQPKDPSMQVDTGDLPMAGLDDADIYKFIDLGEHLWARSQIELLAELGIVKGISDNEYGPELNIKRGDYVTLLVRAFGLAAEYESGFDDVPSDTYYYHTISVAKALGVAKGIDEYNFNPEGLITRQDMMTLTERALVRLGYINEEYDLEGLNAFIDKEDISEYAQNSVASMIANKFIIGNDEGKINPHSNTTRAEAAVCLYRIYYSTRGK